MEHAILKMHFQIGRIVKKPSNISMSSSIFLFPSSVDEHNLKKERVALRLPFRNSHHARPTKGICKTSRGTCTLPYLRKGAYFSATSSSSSCSLNHNHSHGSHPNDEHLQGPNRLQHLTNVVICVAHYSDTLGT